jgi:hypothetical protein
MSNKALPLSLVLMPGLLRPRPPWHAIPSPIPDHRPPPDGINRVRKTVYDTISRVRHELNGEERHEPAGF